MTETTDPRIVALARACAYLEAAYDETEDDKYYTAYLETSHAALLLTDAETFEAAVAEAKREIRS